MTETMVTVVPRLGLRAPACLLYAATACSSSVRVSARYASTRYVIPAALSLAKFSMFGICMGRSFLVGLCENSHRIGLDRSAHFFKQKAATSLDGKAFDAIAGGVW